MTREQMLKQAYDAGFAETLEKAGAREFTEAEKKRIRRARWKFGHGMFAGKDQPATKLLTSPGLKALIGAALGATGGGMIGAISGSPDIMTVGALGGAAGLGAIGYGGAEARNKEVISILRNLPEDATIADVRSYIKGY